MRFNTTMFRQHGCDLFNCKCNSFIANTEKILNSQKCHFGYFLHIHLIQKRNWLPIGFDDFFSVDYNMINNISRKQI